MADDLIEEIREKYLYNRNAWEDIHREGAKDMRYVSGDPWDQIDKDARKDRPMIAPEEMSQYRNQVINLLRANPRGMKFSPNGNGANDAGARFYQDKARETEYRSHAAIAYATAAECALQRSYGYLRVDLRYASPRSANQEIWIEPFPDPDMVEPEFDAKRPDSSDMTYCFVKQWSDRKKLARERTGRRGDRGKAETVLAGAPPAWIAGTKNLEVEYWKIETRSRVLLLVQMPSPDGQPTPPVQMFQDELEDLLKNMGGKKPLGMQVLRTLRDVDYPYVTMRLTDGLDILPQPDGREVVKWPGKYIPIVSCYGPILYVPEGGEVKKKLLSMTRFGRDPWKAYSYCCSQELEILGQVPHTPVVMYEGQVEGQSAIDWDESTHTPKARLMVKAKTAATGDQLLPLPQRADYTQGEYLQAIETVKEGYRRAIQAAMGSNFLPTQAQRRNEKSGKALDKMEESAAQGTYHFVQSYEDMIRQTGMIFEDLCDKVYDYQGETSVIEEDKKARPVQINDTNNPKAVSTTGDYLVTVSTGPSSDSERDAADDFTETVVGQLPVIMQVAGPPVAAAVLAQSIRMRNLGPAGDKLADLIEPQQFKQQDGQEPPSSEVMSLKTQVQHLTQQLQAAGQQIQTKQVEQQGKLTIVQTQEQAETDRADKDREAKLAIAAIGAKVETLQNLMNLFMEERARIGTEQHEIASDSAAAAHELRLAGMKHAHDVAKGAADAALTERASGRQHAHEAAQAETGIEGQLAVQAAAPTPDPTAGDGTGAAGA